MTWLIFAKFLILDELKKNSYNNNDKLFTKYFISPRKQNINIFLNTKDSLKQNHLFLLALILE